MGRRGPLAHGVGGEAPGGDGATRSKRPDRPRERPGPRGALLLAVLVTAALVASSIGGPGAGGALAARPGCPAAPVAGGSCLHAEARAGGSGGSPPSNASSQPEFGSVGSVALPESDPTGLVYVPTCGCLEVIGGSYLGELQLVRNSSVVGNVSFDQPTEGVAYSPVSGEVYVGLSDGVIDVLQGTDLVRAIDLADGGAGCGAPMAYDPADRDILIGCSVDGGGIDAVQVLDPANDSLVVVNMTSVPTALTYDPADGEMIVVLTPGPAAGGLVVLNGTSVVETISGSSFLSPSPVSAAYDGADGWLYVSGRNASPSCSSTCGFVSVLNGTSLVATIGAGSYPGALSYDPTTGTVDCANEGSDNVTAIRGTSVIGSRPTGDLPFALAYDPADEEPYASNFDDANLSVFSTYLTIDPLTASASGSLPDAVDVGESLPFDSTLAVPGAGGLTASVAITPAGGLICGAVSVPANATPGSTVAFRCTGSTPGTYTVGLNVTDRTDTAVGVSLAVTVDPALMATPPVAVVGAAGRVSGPLDLDVGENLTVPPRMEFYSTPGDGKPGP